MKIPRSPPAEDQLWARMFHDPQVPRMTKIIEAGRSSLREGRYRHWDELVHRNPPTDLSHEEWWLGIKLARAQLLRPIPLVDTSGRPFQFGMPDPVLEMVHGLDQDTSGSITISERVTNPETRDRYLVSSLMEEAITSSQLEGAVTTRRRAQEMIRSGRRPTNRGEQMIVNNYLAVRRIRSFVGERLEPEHVLDLHRVVSEDTLDSKDAEGSLRSEADPVDVVDDRGQVLHHPPPAAQLPDRLEKMCRFANADPPQPFVHPVIRSILLHFWLAYDHPFVDGNGRTARALFYWSMLSHGYSLSEYISISSILRKAPAQYSRSFLHTETDDNDLTYFVLYQSNVIRRAVDELKRYLERKMAEVQDVEGLLRTASGLNHRQIALLSHALKHPGFRYTIQSHRVSHNVVYQTARTDLSSMVELGLLVQGRVGRSFVFTAVPDLEERLRQL